MTEMSIKSPRRTDESSVMKPGCICYTCRVEVDITRHKLCAEGYGVATIQLEDGMYNLSGDKMFARNRVWRNRKAIILEKLLSLRI